MILCEQCCFWKRYYETPNCPPHIDIVGKLVTKKEKVQTSYGHCSRISDNYGDIEKPLIDGMWYDEYSGYDNEDHSLSTSCWTGEKFGCIHAKIEAPEES